MRTFSLNLLFGKTPWGQNRRLVRWKRSIVIGAFAGLLCLSAWYSNHVVNMESTAVYLPEVGPGGTIFLPGDAHYTDAHLQFLLRRCLVQRKQHQQKETR